MFKSRKMINKLYIVGIMALLLITLIPSINVINALAQESVNWNSNVQNGDLKAPEGIGSGTGDWGSQTFTTPENTTNTNENSTSGSDTTTMAILAGIAGVLGIIAVTGITLTKKQVASIIPEGNGIWVPEVDRTKVIDMINKVASKQYYIDNQGFIGAEPEALEDLSKSSTYSKVLDDLITGNKKVVVGINSGWASYDNSADAVTENEFTDSDSGITIGDNGTDQVVVVIGQDTANSKAGITLAHELTHALRGEYSLKNVDTGNDGINHDEEANAIQVENIIRNELGYTLRTDGDPRDDVNNDSNPDGDGSYGRYIDASEEEGWLNNLSIGNNKVSGTFYSHLKVKSKPSVAVVKGSVDEQFLQREYGNNISIIHTQQNQFVGSDRYDTNAMYQSYLSQYGIFPKKPEVRVKAGSADEAILKAQYGKRIKIIEGTKNQFKGDMQCWTISELETDKHICVVEFERQGEDLLTCLAYVTSEQIIFKNYPSKLKQKLLEMQL